MTELICVFKPLLLTLIFALRKLHCGLLILRTKIVLMVISICHHKMRLENYPAQLSAAEKRNDEKLLIADAEPLAKVKRIWRTTNRYLRWQDISIPSRRYRS